MNLDYLKRDAILHDWVRESADEHIEGKHYWVAHIYFFAWMIEKDRTAHLESFHVPLVEKEKPRAITQKDIDECFVQFKEWVSKKEFISIAPIKGIPDQYKETFHFYYPHDLPTA